MERNLLASSQASFCIAAAHYLAPVISKFFTVQNYVDYIVGAVTCGYHRAVYFRAEHSSVVP